MNPSEQIVYAQMAAQLNIYFQFPQYLIQSVLDELLPEDPEEAPETAAAAPVPITAPKASDPSFTIEDVVK